MLFPARSASCSTSLRNRLPSRSSWNSLSSSSCSIQLSAQLSRDCVPRPFSPSKCFACCLIAAVHIQPLCPRKRSEEHTSELQSQSNLVCRLLLEKKKEQSMSRTIHWSS